jgi:RES domain-containing protein
MPAHLEESLHHRMPQVLKLATEFSGTGFRNVGQVYANQKDILSTKGSYRSGGRYNVATAFAVLYLSCDLDTCLAELRYQAIKEGLTIEEKFPRTFIGIRVEARKVLDLTDQTIRRKLGITKKLLLETNWEHENYVLGNEAATQIVGRVAKHFGFEAVLVPSARGGGNNINLIDDGNLPTRASAINFTLLGARTSRKVRAA